MTNPIDEQIDRLRAAVHLFLETYGRVPTVAFDADGVIYEFEAKYLAHHNRMHPHLPPVVGPFERFDVGFGQSPEVAEALQESMRTLDWSELTPFEEAYAVLQVLVEVNLDLSIATSHRVDNTYQPSAKVYQFHRDFDGYFDDRLQIGIDKTRVVADFLIDDKPEVKGKLVPMWDHLHFTQNYNRDIAGVHVTWETMFEVLASVIEAKATGRTLTPAPAAVPAETTAAVLPVVEDSGNVQLDVDEDAEPEPLPQWLEDTAATPAAVDPVTMPWLDDEPAAAPTVEAAWDDIVNGGDQK